MLENGPFFTDEVLADYNKLYAVWRFIEALNKLSILSNAQAWGVTYLLGQYELDDIDSDMFMDDHIMRSWEEDTDFLLTDKETARDRKLKVYKKN